MMFSAVLITLDLILTHIDHSAAQFKPRMKCFFSVVILRSYLFSFSFLCFFFLFCTVGFRNVPITFFTVVFGLLCNQFFDGHRIGEFNFNHCIDFCRRRQIYFVNNGVILGIENSILKNEHFKACINMH